MIVPPLHPFHIPNHTFIKYCVNTAVYETSLKNPRSKKKRTVVNAKGKINEV